MPVLTLLPPPSPRAGPQRCRCQKHKPIACYVSPCLASPYSHGVEKKSEKIGPGAAILVCASLADMV